MAPSISLNESPMAERTWLWPFLLEEILLGKPYSSAALAAAAREAGCAEIASWLNSIET